MPSGKLFVSPLTIHGLDQNGFPTSQTFIGCYISQSEKQRTNSAPGPQPHFKDTLTCTVSDSSETLFLDVINEDPSYPGVIGSGQLSLKQILDTGRFEDWVPLQSTNGGHLGHLYMKLSFTSSSYADSNPYGIPPPADTPIPSGHDASERSTYNPNAGISTLEATGHQQPVYNPNGSASSFSPTTGTPPVAVAPKPKKQIPDWMKYGGAAIAGAAAAGLGTWAVHELRSDDEEEKEAEEAQQMSQQPYAPPQQSYAPQDAYGLEATRGFTGPDEAELARREEQEDYEDRRREEEERYEARRREEEERYEARRREEEERYDERRREEEEEAEAEAEAEEEEEANEEEECSSSSSEEEDEEEEVEEAEEEEKPACDDSKWR